MPIRVIYKNDSNQPCTIRPTPFWSVGTNILKNGAGEAFGVNYTITLTGTLIADQGAPYAIVPEANLSQVDNGNGPLRYPFYGYGDSPQKTPNVVGPYSAFDANMSHFIGSNPGRPLQQIVPITAASHAIFTKQRALRALFAQDGQRVELSDWDDNEATIICYPRVVDIQFEEGIYVDICRYTITLEADTLLNYNVIVDEDGTLITGIGSSTPNITESGLLASLRGAFIQDYSEDWSIEEDDTLTESPLLPKSYRITHSINATGKTHYGPTSTTSDDVTKRKAWEQARDFVQRKLVPEDPGLSGSYPNIPGLLGKGSLNLIDAYQGYSLSRTEQVSESAGTYSVTETWLIASGTAYENYNMSINTDIGSVFVSVSIDGNIDGLSSLPIDGYYNLASILSSGTKYYNALNKYYAISNSGQFGYGSDIYKRVNNAVAVELNSQPNSVALSLNEYTGTITYNLAFDNRPTNIISGVLSEQISVSDTYPGDIFATIPVLGRVTGPVLQYLGSRSEYRRDVSINLLMDYTKIPYVSGRQNLLLKKPSVIEPTATQLATLIKELSPQGEPGVRKYFLSPPQENWNPKEGSYNLTISWTYELSQ